MLGRYETTTNLNIAGFTSNLTKDELDQDTFVLPLIGNYTPYTISATLDFRGETLGLILVTFTQMGGVVLQNHR